jgi:ankyrin repeat protein
MFASMKGDVQLVNTILKHKPNVNMKDINNRNALFYAIDSGRGDNADVVITLIAAGISVNEIEKAKGHSPLSLATMKNLRNTVKAILDNQGDPNHAVESTGNTPLHHAIMNSNIDIVKMLINREANVNVINNDNMTPIALALNLSSTDIYKILVEEINRLSVKENEIVHDLITEEAVSGQLTTSSTKKKKKDVNYSKDNNANNDFVNNKIETNNEENNFNDETIKKQINYSNMGGRKIKKPTKIEFIEFIREKNKGRKMSNSNYNLEIPFSFTGQRGETSHSSFNSFISIYAKITILELQSTPVLHIDLSDKSKEDICVMNHKVEELSYYMSESDRRIKSYEEQLRFLSDEVNIRDNPRIINSKRLICHYKILSKERISLY